ALRAGEAGEVGGELALEEADLQLDRSADGEGAPEALPRYEAEMRPMRRDIVDEGVHGAADRLLARPRDLPRGPHEPAHRAEGLVDEEEPELLHIAEVP